MLRLRGAGQIVQIVGNCTQNFLLGDAMAHPLILTRNPAENSDFLGILVGVDGKIVDLGWDRSLDEKYPNTEGVEVIDVEGKVLMPGLVDAHTHPVFAGDRVHEFVMKLAGASYMQVHKGGGGISFTVEKTRAASEQELSDSFEKIAKSMLKCGTTLLEAKSGYGLDTENEMKMLRVLDKVNQKLPIEISATFCGAHALPPGKTAEEATEDVILRQLPALVKEKNEGKLQCVENCDVFCEEGIFSTDQAEQILTAGKNTANLRANFHGDELRYTASAELAGEIGAWACSHLEEISEPGMEAIAESGTVAVLLPTTAYVLRLDVPSARRLISSGCCVALGSDFNPNAYCYSMPLVMNLACLTMTMKLEEALVASTLHAANSLGRGTSHGALAVGRVGDVLVIDAPRWEHLVYRMACHQQLVHAVVKGGKVAYRRADD